MNAFVTGSRAYGTPRPDSDTDLVLLVSSEDLARLRVLDESPERDPEGYSGASGSLRVGGLNLITFTRPALFQAWKAANDELVACKPVTRATACELIKAKLKAAAR